MSRTRHTRKPRPTIPIYVDWPNTGYLELHAMRAPVGRYLPEYEQDQTLYDRDVAETIERFELEEDVTIVCLGRSGRHICIEDTPANRRRFWLLQRKAIDATREMWAEMREPEGIHHDA